VYHLCHNQIELSSADEVVGICPNFIEIQKCAERGMLSWPGQLLLDLRSISSPDCLPQISAPTRYCSFHGDWKLSFLTIHWRFCFVTSLIKSLRYVYPDVVSHTGSSVWKRTLCAGALLGEEAREDKPYGIHGTHFAKIHLSFSYRTTDQMHVLISMQVNIYIPIHFISLWRGVIYRLLRGAERLCAWRSTKMRSGCGWPLWLAIW